MERMGKRYIFLMGELSKVHIFFDGKELTNRYIFERESKE